MCYTIVEIFSQVMSAMFSHGFKKILILLMSYQSGEPKKD